MVKLTKKQGTNSGIMSIYNNLKTVYNPIIAYENDFIKVYGKTRANVNGYKKY